MAERLQALAPMRRSRRLGHAVQQPGQDGPAAGARRLAPRRIARPAGRLVCWQDQVVGAAAMDDRVRIAISKLGPYPPADAVELRIAPGDAHGDGVVVDGEHRRRPRLAAAMASARARRRPARARPPLPAGG